MLGKMDLGERVVAQVVECLLCMQKVPSSVPRISGYSFSGDVKDLGEPLPVRVDKVDLGGPCV